MVVELGLKVMYCRCTYCRVGGGRMSECWMRVGGRKPMMWTRTGDVRRGRTSALGRWHGGPGGGTFCSVSRKFATSAVIYGSLVLWGRIDSHVGVRCRPVRLWLWLAVAGSCWQPIAAARPLQTVPASTRSETFRLNLIKGATTFGYLAQSLGTISHMVAVHL